MSGLEHSGIPELEGIPENSREFRVIPSRPNSGIPCWELHASLERIMTYVN